MFCCLAWCLPHFAEVNNSPDNIRSHLLWLTLSWPNHRRWPASYTLGAWLSISHLRDRLGGKKLKWRRSARNNKRHCCQMQSLRICFVQLELAAIHLRQHLWRQPARPVVMEVAVMEDEASPGQTSETTPAARVEVQGNSRFRGRERTLFCLPGSHMVSSSLTFSPKYVALSLRHTVATLAWLASREHMLALNAAS